jgi:hypothetical protein
MSRRIKKPQFEKPKIQIPAQSSDNMDYPVFCFRYLQTQPQKDYKFYADFIVRLKKLSSLSWKQISVSGRHQFGTEKMPISQIKPTLPKFVTPDVDALTVFRATGDNRPFLVLRRDNVFHIIFIEENFGDIYDHGNVKKTPITRILQMKSDF